MLIATILVGVGIIILPKIVEAVTTEDQPIIVERPGCLAQSTIQNYARCKVADHWDDTQWDSFNAIINKESMYWKVNKEHNPELSTAYGLGGFLDATWGMVGCEKTSNRTTQIDCTIKYIDLVYGTPKIAWAEHRRKGWY